ncbi:uncharacterized protein LOC131619697 [Vicia villosa]|uniref:uncharacterized protein LOC131619697 n=1 Tax=Vicia villosa TaxID=3911 RepID=UPI00273A7ABC|nr:uncharacterized protein LOC131619697 [Vicia villosa]
MKFKLFIFMFFLCAIVLISVMAIRPFKSEESKANVWIDRNKGLGRAHSDDIDWVGSGTWGGWGGSKEEGGERENNGSGWEGAENEAPGWGGGEENEGSSWGGGNEGPEEDGRGFENGDR